ncbi:MAG: hypothetical protein ACK4UN_13435 [Limisphaerales bacterium]
MWHLRPLMKEAYFFVRGSLVLVFLCLASNAFALASGELSANEIIYRAVERAKNNDSEQTAFAFTQKTVKEERDARGQIKERKERSDLVVFRNGTYFKRPTDPTVSPVAETDNDLLQDNSSKPSKRKEYLDLLTPELVNKYVFALVNQTYVNGREVYQVAFQPRGRNLPASDLKEKIMNHATGTLWIDAAEFELVRAQVHINNEIPVAGLLGALKRAAFSLERMRHESGVWFERFYRTDYEARKLAQVKRVTTQSECANFRRINNG